MFELGRTFSLHAHKFVNPLRYAHFCGYLHRHNMRSNLLFYFALALNAITLLVTISSAVAMLAPTKILDGTDNGMNISDGMTAFGRLMTWLIPLGLIALMAIAFWLRSKGRLLAANILMCIPALPMLAGIVIWGGLAVLFILFGK